jgi:alpha-N-acetylglucosamine transferase
LVTRIAVQLPPAVEQAHQFAHMRQLNAIPHCPKFAIVTLATQPEYLIPAYALGTSLRAQRTVWPTVALLSRALAANADVVANLTIAGFNFIHVVDTIDNPARQLTPERVAELRAHGKSIQPHKMDVFTKLRIFEMTQFDRILFLDADTVVTDNVDHLLYEERPYSVVPSLVHMDECTGRADADRQFVFDYKDRLYCQSHALEPYHDVAHIAYSNTGVLVIEPSLRVFDELIALLARELDYDDTCVGTHGCNDQRLLNLYYHERPDQVGRLGLVYNVDCDQFGDADFINGTFEPRIVHYRGHKKPWALDDESTRCDWRERDRCGSFINMYEKFERAYLRTALHLDKDAVDEFYSPGRCRRNPHMTEEEKLRMKRDKQKCRQSCLIGDDFALRKNTEKCDKFCKWFPELNATGNFETDDDDDDEEQEEEEETESEDEKSAQRRKKKQSRRGRGSSSISSSSD